MNFKREVEAISGRVITEDLMKTIIDDYIEKSKNDIGEVEYREAVSALAGVDDVDGTMLTEAEALCRENIKYVIKFGYERGIYACFRQYFDADASDRPFADYAEKQILIMPEMLRHSEFRNRRTVINDMYEKMEEAVCKELREHIVSIETTWFEREEGALRYGFYLGYRYALKLLYKVNGGESYTKITNMSLMVERELGLVQSVIENEGF